MSSLHGSSDSASAFTEIVERAVLDELLEPLAGSLVVIDAAQDVVYVSPSISELLGYRPDELVGRNVREIIDTEVSESTLDLVGLRSGLSNTSTRVRVRSASGERCELAVYAGNGTQLDQLGYWALLVERVGGVTGHLDALRQRLVFEDLLTRIASSLVRHPLHQLDEGIDEALEAIARHARVDRAFLLVLDEPTATVILGHEWAADGVARRGEDTMPVAEMSTWLAQLSTAEPVFLMSAVDRDATCAAGEVAFLERGGTHAVLVAPVLDDCRLVGAIVVESLAERVWSDDHLTVLESAAGILAQALARRDAENRVTGAFHQAPLGMAVLDANGVHLDVNEPYCELVGRTPEELAGLSVTELIVREDRLTLLERFRGLLERRSDKMVIEVTVDHPGGAGARVRAHCAAVVSGGELREVVVHVEDVSERHRREQELLVSEERYRTLVENSPAIVTRFDRRQRMVYTSPAFERHGDARVLTELFTSEANVARWQSVLDRVLTTGERDDGEWAVEIDGRRRWFQSRAVPEYDGAGAIANVLVMATDITALKRTEAELAHRALHDPLTGLANRTLLEESVDNLLRTGVALHSVSLLFLDLDRFKVINDSLGHHAGDHLIAVVAARLQAAVPAKATIARIGGDEFVVVLDDLGDLGEPMRVAEHLRSVVAAPIQLGATQVTPTVSVGIAVLSDLHDSAEDLLRDADSAMYLAKERGRNRSEFCDDDLRRQASDRLEMENQLRRSVDLGGLHVCYQPEFEMDAEGVVRILGAEALARWNHPTRGLLEAGRFIELAEETGIILDLGRWVLMEACRQGGEWHRRWPDHGLVVRVNLSPRQLADPDLVDWVVQAVGHGGIEPESLCLEITETALMDDPEMGGKVLAELHALGVSLAVDDFGTGYSSLAQLKRFPVDVLKIDRSFVDGLGTDAEDTAIVEAIVSMAGALGLDVVAEGVESDRQREELVRIGCMRGQGFGLARPMPPDELLVLLEEGCPASGDSVSSSAVVERTRVSGQLQ